jgi:hypothetical protein
MPGRRSSTWSTLRTSILPSTGAGSVKSGVIVFGIVLIWVGASLGHTKGGFGSQKTSLGRVFGAAWSSLCVRCESVPSVTTCTFEQRKPSVSNSTGSRVSVA